MQAMENGRWTSSSSCARSPRPTPPTPPPGAGGRPTGIRRPAGGRRRRELHDGAGDIRGVLGAIHVPELVLHRSGDRAADVRASRYMAGRLPSRPSANSPGTTTSRSSATRTRSRAERRSSSPARCRQPSPTGSATVLFTDIVGSTARAAELATADGADLLDPSTTDRPAELARFRGQGGPDDGRRLRRDVRRAGAGDPLRPCAIRDGLAGVGLPSGPGCTPARSS